MEGTNIDRIQKELCPPLDSKLASELLSEYILIKRAYASGSVEAQNNHVTKFCETVFQLLELLYSGKYSSRPDITRLCLSLEQSDKTKFSQSVRVILPRMTRALYTIRSERGEHKVNDIPFSHIDGTLEQGICDWIVAEFLRLYHKSDEKDIKQLLLEIQEKKFPVIEVFEDNGVIFHLPNASIDDKILAVLYQSNERVSNAELARRLRVSYSQLITSALGRLHKKSCVDRNPDGVKISATGKKNIEKKMSQS
jgi:hypothetical protein